MSQRLLQYWIKHWIKCPDMPAHAVQQGVCAWCVRGKRNLGWRGIAEKRRESARVRPASSHGKSIDCLCSQAACRSAQCGRRGAGENAVGGVLRMHGVVCHLTTRLHRISPWHPQAAALALASHRWCHSAPSTPCVWRLPCTARYRSAAIPTVHAATHTPWSPPPRAP